VVLPVIPSGPSPVQLAHVDPALIRPRRHLYAAACLPAVVGVIAAILLAAGAIDSGGSDFDRLTTAPTEFNAPGTTTVHLTDHHGATIYLHASSNGYETGSATPDDLSCTVRAPSGASVALHSSLGAFTLTRSGETYRALYSFPVTQTGDYTTTCSRSGTNQGPIPLGVGPRLSAGDIVGLFAKIGGAIGSIVLGLGISSVLCVLVLLARRRSRTRLAEPPAS